MALTFFWRCETSGSSAITTGDYSPGFTRIDLINSGDLSTTQARAGTYSLRHPTAVAGGAATYASNELGGSWPGNAGAVGFSVYQESTFGSGNTGTGFGFRCRNDANTHRMDITYTGDTTGKNLGVRLIGPSGTIDIVALTGDQFDVDAWYGVVLRFDYANDKIRLELYNASGTLVDSATSTSTDLSGYIPSDWGVLVFGQASSSHPDNVYFDNYLIADSYDEPLQNNFAIASYDDYDGSLGSQLILPHRSSGGLIDLSGNFRG